MLEDGEWDKADGFFEQALNEDAESAEAFFGKTLAGMKCRDVKAFELCFRTCHGAAGHTAETV